jgi:hypothetical protein
MRGHRGWRAASGLSLQGSTPLDLERDDPNLSDERATLPEIAPIDGLDLHPIH